MKPKKKKCHHRLTKCITFTEEEDEDEDEEEEELLFNKGHFCSTAIAFDISYCEPNRHYK